MATNPGLPGSDQLRRSRRRGQQGGTRKALDECPESERRFEWHYLDRLLVGEEKTTLPKTSNATAFAFHGPDGNAVAVAKTIPGEDKAIIRVIAVASSDDRFELNIFESPVRRMVYLESKKLAVLAGTKPGRLYLFDWQEVTGMEDTVASPTHIAFSPQADQLLVLNAAGQLRHHDANDARPVGTIRSFLPRDLEDADSVRMAILPRDLGVVVSNPAGGDIRVWPVGSPQERRDDLTRTIEGKIQWMTSDAEGTLAVATNTRRLCFGKMNGGDSISPYTGLKGEVKHMAFSPDGKRLAIAYADDTLAVLGYLPPRPEELRINNKVEPAKWVELLTIPVSGVRGVEFSPNGTALAVANPQGVVVLGAWK